jgi:serine/threonine protein kinase
MTDVISSRIDRYELYERIGTGGMARVYRAKDLNLDRIVAIKILHDHLADDPTFKERFEREARFVAALNHPNIVQIFDFNAIERDGFPIYYMVMPFIAGRSLRDVIEDVESRGERLSYDRIMRLMLDVTDALSYAHAAGVVHRDVKPANILIDTEGKAVLTDFGIARMAQGNSSRLTQDGMSTGTPAYMSPEQVSGQPGDARSDLYSLGCIFFELLAARAPYDDEGGASLMLKHLQAPIPLISNYLDKPDANLDAFIRKALAKDPEERFQTAKEFSRALREVYAGKDPTQTNAMPAVTLTTRTLPQVTTPTAEASSPKQSRSPLIAGGMAVVVIVAAIIVTTVMLTRTQSLVTPTATAIPPLPTIAAFDPGSLNALMFTSDFSAKDSTRDDWPQDNVGGFLREITPEGLYHLRSERVSTASTSLFDTQYAYGSVSIAMSGTLQGESNPSGAFGIAFRYQDQDHYNVFAVDGLGRFSIWVRDDGVWHELRNQKENWTPNAAIKPLGGKNQLRVDILGDKITGIVNGRQVALVQDKTFSSGNVGIYVATDTSGITDALIDQYQVFPVSPPSMTGTTGQ